MFLGTRMFLHQHALIFYIAFVAFVGLFMVNAWTLIGLLIAAFSSESEVGDILPSLQAAGLLAIFGLYILTEYTIWVVRYYYFFKLYKLVGYKMANTDIIHLLNKDTLLEITKEEELYRIAIFNPATVEASTVAVIGNGYFNEGGPTTAMRYLGPVRSLSDAKTFKRWYLTVKQASPRRTSFRGNVE